jgi:hypothetical protein
MSQIPAILTFKGKQTSISSIRAIKHALDMLDKYAPEGETPDDLQTAIDDLELMLQATKD